VRLPNLSIFVEPPEGVGVRRTREDFGLRDDDTVYIVTQSLFKMMPNQDDLFAQIAARVPQARFVFIEHVSSTASQAFKRRVHRALARYGESWDRRCMMTPRLSESDFLELNRHADVFLDVVGWSGGMTALEALAGGCVPVTWPGPWMRTRHTFALLQQLGVLDTVASSQQEYVTIAARLAEDRDFLQAMRRRIRQNLHKPYRDRGCIEGLEHFLERVVDRQ